MSVRASLLQRAGMLGVDWAQVFVPDLPVLEIVVRGTIVYLSLFFMLRFIVRREAGSLGITDLLVLVLLADAAQNAMSSDYNSLTDGLILVATIVSWSVLLDWLAYRSVFWRKLLRPPPVQIVRDGRIIHRHLDREKISEEELMGELRNHGVDDVGRVRAAWIESDGTISVMTRGGDGENKAPPRRNAGLGA